MKKFNAKIPVLGMGLANFAMKQLLTQIRHQHGLTRFIQRNGVNGRWLRADEPYDIHISRFFHFYWIKYSDITTLVICYFINALNNQ